MLWFPDIEEFNPTDIIFSTLTNCFFPNQEFLKSIDIFDNL